MAPRLIRASFTASHAIVLLLDVCRAGAITITVFND
jgi:hypothetical protein